MHALSEGRSWTLSSLRYTSLGSSDDTHPNPALQVHASSSLSNSCSSSDGYRPAYMLLDDKLERAGRSTV